MSDWLVSFLEQLGYRTISSSENVEFSVWKKLLHNCMSRGSAQPPFGFFTRLMAVLTPVIVNLSEKNASEARLYWVFSSSTVCLISQFFPLWCKPLKHFNKITFLLHKQGRIFKNKFTLPCSDVDNARIGRIDWNQRQRKTLLAEMLKTPVPVVVIVSAERLFSKRFYSNSLKFSTLEWINSYIRTIFYHVPLNSWQK